MVWTLAFSIQHEVEKYGAYLAVASFLGLALLRRAWSVACATGPAVPRSATPSSRRA
jgi:hypothetical protein